MRVLVCGGRRYDDKLRLFEILDGLQITTLIYGGASGADHLAGMWAFQRNVSVEIYPADWEAHGRAAGLKRNIVMLTASKPDLVVAFPGGSGTLDMIARAKAQGVPVRIVDPEKFRNV